MNVHSQKRVAQRGQPQRGRGRPPIEGLRAQLLDAALRTFAERGYHGAAVPEVARAAGVATGTLYRYFASKEALVNEVFRAAKTRLRAALFDGMDVDRARDGAPEPLFGAIWRRLCAFARAEPLAFRFLEMQDHAPYLDATSRALERAVLHPIWLGASRLGRAGHGRMSAESAIAFVWGALVGLFKAERLGYVTLDDATLDRARVAAWTAVMATTEPPRRRRG